MGIILRQPFFLCILWVVDFVSGGHGRHGRFFVSCFVGDIYINKGKCTLTMLHLGPVISATTSVSKFHTSLFAIHARTHTPREGVREGSSRGE